VISRAAFGVRANVLPIVPVLLSKFFWVVAAAVAAAVLLGASTDYLPAPEKSVISVGGFEVSWSAGYVALVLALAGLATAWGGRVLASLQKLGGLFGVAVAAVILIAEAPHLSNAKLDFSEGVSNLEVLTAAILIVACMGLAWVSSGADFARKLPNSALGLRVVGWALVGLAVVPTIVGVVSAAAFSDLGLAKASNPVLQLSAALPQWAIELLVPGLVSTLVVWIAMSLYSANLGMQAIGLKLKAATGASVLAALAWLIAGLGYPLLAQGGVWQNLAGLALGFGVPVAAWAGVFVADVLLRRIAYHEVSLSRAYGFYGSANWVNLAFWLVAVVLGYAMTAADLFGTRIEGALIVEPAGALTANLGLFAAGVVGLLGPLLLGIPRIKRQEREVLSIEARRRDLADIFDGNRELGFDQ
jgi:purine-cytosine permease-like protein